MTTKTSYSGLQIALQWAIALLSGAVRVETIFSWPGSGQVALTAVLRRDLPVLMACVVYIGVVVTVVNFVVDVAYAAVDPRVRYA